MASIARMANTQRTTLEQLKERFPDVPFVPVLSPEKHPAWQDPGFAPGTIVLPAGHRKAEGYRAFGVPTVYERDAAVPMRDGVELYTDVFRPEGVKVPAIIAWSPYGKAGGPQQYETFGPYSCGVDHKYISGYHKFEAPDPADWAERGYALVNIDARGAAYSQGDAVQWGPQEAEDIYDTITWIAKQPWSDGSVVMAGNSWLAIAQLNFASRFEHPALKAIAPWEGLTDAYRDIFMRGGFPHLKRFTDLIQNGGAGFGTTEAAGEARKTRPFFDEYWATKKSNVENISIPMYVTASYSSQLHTAGSFEAFEVARTPNKWLRVHPYQEWYDLYRREMNDELQRFFDRYAKGIKNGWEDTTPRVRLSLLGFDGSSEPTVVERPYPSYPVPGTTNATYYLDASSHSLSSAAPTEGATASHAGHSLDATSDFKLVFDRRTEVAGYASVRLYMSCDEHDDMDVVVQLRKLDAKGNLLTHVNYPLPIPVDQFTAHTNITTTLGPQGQLRASHVVTRDSSPARNDNIIVYKHDRAEPVPPGTIVPLEFTLWPMGMVFGPGEALLLRVSGHHMALAETPHLVATEPEDANVGTHVVHTGGEHVSQLVLPILPEVEV